MVTPRKLPPRKPAPEARTLAEIGRDAAREAQRKALLAALKAADWNLTATAEALGMSTAGNVIRSIRALGLDDQYEAARAAGKIAPGGRYRD